jgi:hypothetical protein
MPTFPNQGAQGANNAGSDPSVVPFTSATVSCTSAAGGTSICTIPADGSPVVLTNAATATVYIGNSGVTTTTGYPVPASGSVLVTYGMFAPDSGGVSCALYGIVASTSSVITYLQATNWPGNE